ncbi:serine hydrolase domain-containing protein [Duganella violaceipulchra]|uniref:CubicO group peptidase (Beta-lactamase class C family) n=2 Tax=Duganella violaceipulchra TaxID=2849652 RepID=A0ABT1GE03_9BURK|nr:serine hydrolase [Duganella violaceicalia]MCP2007186.1 CubicO group peptidase (beta-lactamase class C family) [Duganella violaceicalia]
MKREMQALMGMLLMAGASGGGMAASLDQELAAIAADPAMPLASLSVLAVRGGKVRYQYQTGQRRIGAAAAPANADTLFRIASVSKMMTTFGVMRLIEQHQLELDADVSRYLGYALRNPHFPDQPISLRMLLTHTSSLRDEAGYFWGADVAIRDRLTGGAAGMWAGDHGPGGYFTYTNLNWGVIGTIMEKVSGERFDRLMKRLLLEPMGLRGGYNPSEFSPEEIDNVATLYRKRAVDSEVWNPDGPWIAQVDDYGVRPPVAPAGLAGYVAGSNGTLFSPTGGLRISAADLGKIMQMLTNHGRYQDRQILQPESVALMFRQQWKHNGSNGDTHRGLYHSWGLGSQRFDDRRLVEGGGFSAVGHLGEAYGLISTFVVDLRRSNGMVSLIGGTGADPDRNPGRYSAMTRSEERILTALYRHAILGR